MSDFRGMRPMYATDTDFSEFRHIVFDVDGVLTDGKFHYNRHGKELKAFGADDNDALKLIRKNISIHFVSADQRGLNITQARIHDMGYVCQYLNTKQRITFIKNLPGGAQRVIYMGDGIFDPLVFKEVGYSITPANAHKYVKNVADHVTEAKGGEGAVAEVCIDYWQRINECSFDITKINLDEL